MRTTLLKRLGRPTPSDVSSGLVTGLFSIPEGMAYASIGGFNPVTGIYAGVWPTVAGSLFARTVLMVTTLTSAIALTAHSVLEDAKLDPTKAGNVAALTLMVGAVMLLFGLLRLGVVLSFVSNAVMTGFSTGIAVQIITGVLDDATGYKPPEHNKLADLGDWIGHFGSWQTAPTLVALATVCVYLAAHRVKRLEPVALLVALVVVTVAVGVLGTGVKLAKDIGTIPGALPPVSLPDWSAMPHLWGGALSVALVALAQAAGIGASVPNPDGSRSDMNADFRAQGLANLGGGFTSALPAGGSLSRTGVAVSAGAKTRWAGIFAGLWLALIVLLFGSLAGRIPMPVIGGLILVIGIELIAGRRQDILLVLRTSRLSALAMVVTFLATTQLPLQQAIIIGAVLSLLLYCVQAARQSRLVALTPAGDGDWTVGPVPPRLPSDQVTVLYYGGVNLFAELPRIDAQRPDPHGSERAVVVLAVRGAPDVPSSAVLKLLGRYADEHRACGGRLIVAGAGEATARLLEQTGVSARLGEGGVVRSTPRLMEAVEQAVAEGHRWIAEQQAGRPAPEQQS
ncbi:SulP family inorganic anion transporter [Streptacidiphilus sp. N1-3]|uniref:SulP family inorganic anion transporter n=1 Tax=Streptacidiphilus alkalitolerans TaxID=3342712 RepID=A0ABV6X3V0_9ACTN